ncbi:grasp-with-spasm system SPASM domain peptide maturase [Flavobacterium tructae]|uniref:grasp-with-spasm system SPASM domain peptide maturase n=1 Tax=Flavobacterium tructae TaxID=1114873 RepID=UPI002551EC43|nr:grasp-with-spasm system SPASM domain peptide maturase [Flavobacterium tructae]MDL2141418.1 grasp-with-spasm system SPASM domain peptide maturase [Flavobacterium tructae]
MKNKRFKLFSDCIPVKGFSRSIIYDLTRKTYDFIPNGLFEILEQGIIDVEDYYKTLEKSVHSIFEDYIQFLLEKEYIFEIYNDSEISDYPNLELEFDYPSKISNAVIDFDDSFDLLLESVSRLEMMNCNFLSIRILSEISCGDLEKILDFFFESVIFSIDIVVNYNSNLSIDFIKTLILKSSRINSIFVFGSPIDQYDNSLLSNGMGDITYLKGTYQKDKILKIKGEQDFIVNIKLFTESMNFNNFYNKKVYISERGDVKNSPFTEEVIGNIFKDLLDDLLNKDSFTNLWKVKKDNIVVCKDCEFRYMCVDNRIPKVKSDSEWFFEDECNYNPYLHSWK